MMKKYVLSHGAMALICSAILAACGGSSSSGSLPSSKATDTNSTASSAELKAAQNAAAQAKADASSAQTQLKDAQSKLEKAQKDLADAQANGKTTADELNKLKAELEKAKADAESVKKEVEELAKTKQEVQELTKAKQEIEEKLTKAQQELDKLNSPFMAAATSVFGVKTSLGVMNMNTYDTVQTDIISINNQDKTITATSNPNPAPEFNSITINGVRVSLLEQEVKKGTKSLSLKALDVNDFETGKMPAGAKGWVGSLGETNNPDNKPVFDTMRFGVYTDENNTSHLFVQGRPTAGVTISRDNGTYQYQGSAIIGKDGEYKDLPDSLSGQVDFAKKELDFNLKVDDTPEGQYKLGAKISGNTFSGQSADGVFTQGGFYGRAGDTLGGVLQFNEGKYSGYHGVYGAGRVK